MMFIFAQVFYEKNHQILKHEESEQKFYQMVNDVRDINNVRHQHVGC